MELDRDLVSLQEAPIFVGQPRFYSSRIRA